MPHPGSVIRRAVNSGGGEASAFKRGICQGCNNCNVDRLPAARHSGDTGQCLRFRRGRLYPMGIHFTFEGRPSTFYIRYHSHRYFFEITEARAESYGKPCSSLQHCGKRNLLPTQSTVDRCSVGSGQTQARRKPDRGNGGGNSPEAAPSLLPRRWAAPTGLTDDAVYRGALRISLGRRDQLTCRNPSSPNHLTFLRRLCEREPHRQCRGSARSFLPPSPLASDWRP